MNHVDHRISAFDAHIDEAFDQLQSDVNTLRRDNVPGVRKVSVDHQWPAMKSSHMRNAATLNSSKEEGQAAHLLSMDSAIWAVRGVFLALVAYFAFEAVRSRTATPGQLDSSSVATTSLTNRRIIDTPIQEIQVGGRVIGRNPIRAQAESWKPDSATWRKLELHMKKQSGRSLWITLIRPTEWIEKNKAVEGSTIQLALHEMGAVGPAIVTYVGPCPKIRPGDPDPIVTGTFKHEVDGSSRIVSLKLDGQDEVTGVTDNHLYWSIDRKEFVPVSDLYSGERVETLNGEARVVSIESRAYEGFLYNLETTEHVYRVGSIGTLVHNDCLDFARGLQKQRQAGEIIRIDPKQTPRMGELPGYPVPGQPLPGFDRHYIHLENGIVRDPAFPKGIPVDDWLGELGCLNKIPQNQLQDFYGFMPKLD